MPPLIIAHRGASAYAPENTIAAFLLARELGADGIELDVQLTQDRVPVVIHDDLVDRTTDGHGRVTDLTITEISQFDAGRWKTEDYRGERIPTLAQVFEALRDWLHPMGRERPCLINIELKTDRLQTDGLERHVLNVISKYGIQERIVLSSFNPFALYRAKQINPRIRRGLLYDQTMPFYLRGPWTRFLTAPRTMHPDYSMIDLPYMQWARRNRLGVVAWTVNDPDVAHRLDKLNVDGIISDAPDLMREAIMEKKKQSG